MTASPVRQALELPPDLMPESPADRVAEATGAVHVGLYVSAVRCLLTYVAAPVLGTFGVLLGPLGLLLQILGAITSVAGARALWRLGHRARIPYALVAGAVVFASAAVLVQTLQEWRS